ncbi:YfcL family protein [Shewanella gelidii]|uniref:YfcL family protein n=1 Tax=Shewanella gelidii TaxID=1642821 RepID=A0A917NAN3_9GAMM|nr:YfcL family protein [Shewanella gelidii]MCL1098234.1 YfcL family protein [Shewanella gelidii]GGI83621.1 hypothetical protein GCM10009332_21130 [Shewanella gelidii]
MLEKYEQVIDQWIEDIVNNGDDDALFASGYLQGHVAVVLAKLDDAQESDFAALENNMAECMALARKELEDADFALVQTAWLDLRDRLLA